jgi:hypothetical protein
MLLQHPYREVEICRSIAPYQYTISWYRPLDEGQEELRSEEREATLSEGRDGGRRGAGLCYQ